MTTHSPSWSSLASLTVLTAMLLISACQTNSSQEQQQSDEAPLPEGELAIEEPWVRPAPAGSTSALYMSIANGRSSADTLVDVRAPILDSIAIQTSATDTAQGAGPQTANALPIPAQSRVALTPDGSHVRLINVNQSLDENSSLILNLEFSESGLQRVRVPVRSSAPSN